MAKSKKKKTSVAKKTLRTKRMCFHCDGMAHKCDRCGESEAACQCPADTADDDSQVLVDCTDCYGTGIAFKDIVESDLEPKYVEKWKQDKADDN